MEDASKPNEEELKEMKQAGLTLVLASEIDLISEPGGDNVSVERAREKTLIIEWADRYMQNLVEASGNANEYGHQIWWGENSALLLVFEGRNAEAKMAIRFRDEYPDVTTHAHNGVIDDSWHTVSNALFLMGLRDAPAQWRGPSTEDEKMRDSTGGRHRLFERRRLSDGSIGPWLGPKSY